MTSLQPNDDDKSADTLSEGNRPKLAYQIDTVPDERIAAMMKRLDRTDARLAELDAKVDAVFDVAERVVINTERLGQTAEHVSDAVLKLNERVRLNEIDIAKFQKMILKELEAIKAQLPKKKPAKKTAKRAR
jgi:hypothetical protein